MSKVTKTDVANLFIWVRNSVKNVANNEIKELVDNIQEKLNLAIDDATPLKIQNFIAYITIIDKDTRDLGRKLGNTNISLDLVGEIRNAIMKTKLDLINELADRIAANYHKHLE